MEMEMESMAVGDADGIRAVSIAQGGSALGVLVRGEWQWRAAVSDSYRVSKAMREMGTAWEPSVNQGIVVARFDEDAREYAPGLVAGMRVRWREFAGGESVEVRVIEVGVELGGWMVQVEAVKERA